MAILDELAAKLYGHSRAEENIVSTDATTRTYIGTATSDSSDGSVYVALSEDVTMPDDYDGEHGVGVEMPTTVGVSEGDDVVVTVFGGGTLKAPVVTGNPGWGDDVETRVTEAHDLAASVESIAQEAKEVAEATGQHFWPDTDGVHVTEVTQDEWNDSTSPNYHSGANVLLNALGQLFRDGVNNILAILSGTDPGVAIYDGEGNAADNIVALFSKALVRIGGRFADSGRSTASVQFFEDNSALTDLTATHYINTADNQIHHTLALSSTVTDEDLPHSTSRMANGVVEIYNSVYNDGTDYSDEVDVSLGGGTTNRNYGVSLGVRGILMTGNDLKRIAYAVADTLQLTYGTASQAIVTTIPMQQVIVGLTQPGGTWTGNNNTATDPKNGWRVCSFTTRHAGVGAWSSYFTLSGGTITALKDVVLEISGNMYWNSGAVDQYGFGLFTGGTFDSNGYMTNGTGEVSNFNYKGVANGQFSVPFPPRFVHLTAGSHLYVCRYTHSEAVYRNGNNMSYITIKVIEDRSGGAGSTTEYPGEDIG